MHLTTIFILLLIASFQLTTVFAEDLEKVHLTNSWAVHIENGNADIANHIAQKHGFVNIGQVSKQLICCFYYHYYYLFYYHLFVVTF